MSADTATPAPAVVEEVCEKKEVIVSNGNGGDAVPTEAPPAVPTEEGAAAAADVAVAEEVAPKPIDPREDPVGWVGSLFPAGVHKVNHMLLTYVQNAAIEKEEDRQALPGKNELVTRNQFLNFLKDGTLLAKFANALSPGAIETVHEGEAAKSKENQTANIEAFTSFLKEKVGLSDDQVFKAEDLLEKGKAGYNAVFNSLFQTGLKAQEKFNANGIDTDAVIEAASKAVKTNLIQTILNFFKRARPHLKKNTENKDEEKKDESVPEESAAAPAPAEAAAKEENGGPAANPAPAVAAN